MMKKKPKPETSGYLKEAEPKLEFGEDKPTVEWPEKMEPYQGLEISYLKGWNACHGAFMKIIQGDGNG